MIPKQLKNELPTLLSWLMNSVSLLKCFFSFFSSRSQFVFVRFNVSGSFLLDELDKVHLPATAWVVLDELPLEEVLDRRVAADGELGTEKQNLIEMCGNLKQLLQQKMETFLKIQVPIDQLQK